MYYIISAISCGLTDPDYIEKRVYFENLEGRSGLTPTEKKENAYKIKGLFKALRIKKLLQMMPLHPYKKFIILPTIFNH